MTTQIMVYPDISYHQAMRKYALSRESLFEIGFPIVDEPGDRFRINKNNHFGETSIERQKCRCQKTISLDNEYWYCAKECRYHPLKADKKSSWRYKCCGKQLNSIGCVSSTYHTSSYIPLNGSWYISGRMSRNCFNIFALDCEFVFTRIGMEIARVSLVSLYEGIVYDTFVMPEYEILDYNTRFSGINPEDLKQKDVKNLSQVQWDLAYVFLDIDSILIGHGLHSDLKGLHICHDNIIDTSILFPHHKGFPYRYSLQHLAQEHLGITIHDDQSGHNSIEDAKICLQLVALKCGLYDLLNVISGF